MLATQILTDLSETELEGNDNSCEIVGFLTLQGKKHEIKKGDNMIGRDPSVCSIVVNNLTVSKVHSIIESEGVEDTFIYDVGSSNLTKLGKKILKPYYRYKLENGSVVTLGNITGTVNLRAEHDENPTRISPIKTAFKIGSLVTNYNQNVNGNIFDLETQVSQLSQLPKEVEMQPSTSTTLEKQEYTKNLNSHSSTKEADNCTRTRLNYCKNINVKNFNLPSKQIIYSALENSNIFSVITQDQIYSLKEKVRNHSNTDAIQIKEFQKFNAVNPLLEDGQDDIFCSFENFKILNKQNTSTPLKTQDTSLIFRNEKLFPKLNLEESKTLQNDLDIEKEIDLIRNDVEINRSFDEEFSCAVLESAKGFKEPLTQENEYNSSIKLNQTPNISESKTINNDCVKYKEQKNFGRFKEPECDIEVKNMNQLTVGDYNSFQIDSPTKTISQSYLEITIVDDDVNTSGIKGGLNKNFFKASQHGNECNKNNSGEKLLNNVKNTFQYQSNRSNLNEKNIDCDFLKGGKKEMEVIPNTLDNETESFMQLVLENFDKNDFENSVADELNLNSKQQRTQNYATCNFNLDSEKLKLTKGNNKNCNQNIKVEIEEQFSSDSDEFIASQVLKSQVSPKITINNSHETQPQQLSFKSPEINYFPDQKSPNSFLKETNINWSLDFIGASYCHDSVSVNSLKKNIFKESIKSREANLLINQENQKNFTPLTQTKDLNAFVPESSEDDNTPSDLEIIEETPLINEKININIKTENTEIKEEANSNNLNQSFEGKENENSDTSYIFEINDIDKNVKSNDNNKYFENQVSNKDKDKKKEVISEQVEGLENFSQSSESETPDLIFDSENILNSKWTDNNVSNQKFNLYEGNNLGEINSPNTQMLEDALNKIIGEDNKENKKQDSCSSRNLENITNFHKDLNTSKNEPKNLQSTLLEKESPGKRSLDNEILDKPTKKIKKNTNSSHHNEEVLLKSKEEEILNFWQVPNIAQVEPKKSRKLEHLGNQGKPINTADKVENLLSEEFNSHIILNKEKNSDRKEKVAEVILSENSTLLKDPVGRKSALVRNSKKICALEEVPLEVTLKTRVLRSVSKHYGTSIASRNEVITACDKTLFKDSPTKTILKSTLRTRTSLKKCHNSKGLDNKSYFLNSSVNVVFTGFDSPCMDKIIQELGGKRIDDLHAGQVVVTDRVRRTVKFLCAIGLSLPIASPEWLLSSKKEKTFLNPWQYILKDEESEERWDFVLRNALEKSKKKKFLQNFYVFATESVKPPPKDMLLIAECCGATPIVNHSEPWPKKTLILTCEEDKDSWPPPKFRSVKILHFEFLLSGVLQQQTDFKTFQLR